MSPHPLTNFETQKYYQDEPKFHGVYSRNNLPKIKDGSYVINLDEFKSIEAHWITLYVNYIIKVIYFDSFGVQHISKELKKFIGNKNINKYLRMQTYNSIMCVYFCTRFIDFMLKGRGLLDYTNLFSPNKHENNDNLILNYLQKLKKLMKKIYCIICGKYRKF